MTQGMRPRPFALLLCLVSTTALSWGFTGHRRLAKNMQDPLPETSCLRQWFKAKQTFELQDSACNPDRWRETDPSEAPRHFLQVDYATPIASYPRDWAGVETKFGRFALRNGQVPWRVEEVYASLAAAFAAKNETEVLRLSFVLSHYVTDSFSVLHDTSNFDPNNGLHGRWESDMFAKAASLDAIATLTATMYGTPGAVDPKNTIFDTVIVGNGLTGQLIAADQAASGDGGVYDPATYQLQTLFDLTRDLTARRWADALTVQSSLLWSAWAQAGSPELTGFSASCSRAAPAGELVLRGFPAPGGFTHADGGAGGPAADAGSAAANDAGNPNRADAGPGAGGSSGGGTGGGGGAQAAGCSSVAVETSVNMMLLVLMVFLVRRRFP